MKLLETKRILLIVYHLQTDGQIEQINQEIGTFLWHYVNYEQNNWTEWIIAAEFQYNDKKYAATRYTPFELNYRRHHWKGNLTIPIEFPKTKEFLIGLQRSWEEAKKLMDIVKEAMKRQFDKKKQNL